MMNLAMNEHRLTKPGPQNAALRDYDSVRRAIAFISEHWRAQPTIEAMADAAAVTPDELHHLFRRWAGLTPKAFMQALTLDHAKGLLRDSASVLDAALNSGLSGPGRLHDLFVTHEAMSPGEWKNGGAGMTLRLRIPSLAVRHRHRDRQRPRPCRPRLRRSRRGTGSIRRHAAALAERDLCRGPRRHRRRWRSASSTPKLWRAGPAAAGGADRHRLRGAGVGDAAENPDGPRGLLFRHRQQDQQSRRRRAPSAPRSARNPVSFVVPCHRALGKSGALTGYHWGITRKQAMLGWEAGQVGVH